MATSSTSSRHLDAESLEGHRDRQGVELLAHHFVQLGLVLLAQFDATRRTVKAGHRWASVVQLWRERVLDRGARDAESPPHPMPLDSASLSSCSCCAKVVENAIWPSSLINVK